jgi:peroxiredoxin
VRYNFEMTILRRTLRWLGADKEMTHIVAGSEAPGFSLNSLDGTEYSLQKLRQEGPAVVAFFKVSCPVCQFTFPFLERIYKHYGGDGVTFLGVSQDDARDTKDFAKEFGVTFPMTLDEKHKGYPVSNAYGLTNVPTIFLIETDGTVKVSCMGFDKKDLQSIAAELAERKKIPAAALFRPNESVPDHKPG